MHGVVAPGRPFARTRLSGAGSRHRHGGDKRVSARLMGVEGEPEAYLPRPPCGTVQLLRYAIASAVVYETARAKGRCRLQVKVWRTW